MNKKKLIIFYQVMIVISILMILVSTYFVFMYPKQNKAKATKKEKPITELKYNKGICEVIDYQTPATDNPSVIGPISLNALFDEFSVKRVTTDYSILLPKLKAEQSSFNNYVITYNKTDYNVSFLENCYGFKWDSNDNIEFSGNFDNDIKEAYEVRSQKNWTTGEHNITKKSEGVYVVVHSDTVTTPVENSLLQMKMYNLYLQPQNNPEQYYGFTLTVSNAQPESSDSLKNIDELSKKIFDLVYKNAIKKY